MRRPQAFVLLLLVVAGCARGREDDTRTFTDAGISFEHPANWQVTGFSTTVWPRRLAVTSYRVPADAVEGDCGGLAAVELLPPDGALVIVIDYGEVARFPPRPSALTLANGELAEYECFGRSSMFRFRVARRDVQAHLAFGDEAGDDARRQALSILSSIELTATP
jgi:hypothetical protein